MIQGCMIAIIIFVLVCLAVSLLEAIFPLLVFVAIVAAVVFVGYKLYEFVYFHGEKFKGIKSRIDDHIKDCNDLNDHIEELKNVQLGTDQAQYGHSDYHDNSAWSFKRTELKKIRRASNVYSCSRTVCDNSRKNPIPYVCKYFGFKADEETLAKFEAILNDFSAVEDGKRSLVAQREEILESISGEVPFLIKKFSSERLERELGFEEVDLGDTYYPSFKFQYVSSGGNASTENTVVMDLANLEAMVHYLNDRIKWAASVAHQRSLMTRELRGNILKRDNYTCQQCGVSLTDEPHLLLEVDHIIPVSKGGITRADNLRTLCWRCNRSKGAKIVKTPEIQ